MKHFLWQSCQPLLEQFMKSNLYMLYVISKLRKSKIQCFKWCTIRSWNEGVIAIASRSLQAEGRILHSAAKSPFCCEMISQPFCTVLWISPWSFPSFGSRTPQTKRPLLSVAKSAVCCEVISQPFLCIREISQTSFSPAKWSLMLPDICVPTLLDLFFRYFCINFHFLLVFSHSCNSLARKYPRKGKLPSYINSLVNTKKGTLEEFLSCNPIDRYIKIYRIYKSLLCFSFSFIFFFFLANHSLKIFAQRMRG